MKYVIVDMDGTMTLVGDRVNCLRQEPKKWDEYFSRCGEDQPNVPVVQLVKYLTNDYHIIFCTGRRESSSYTTESWLERQGFSIFQYTLLMRPNDDTRHDVELKPELLQKAGVESKDVFFILEDRNSMVAKWRELGFCCIQVAEGDF